MPSARRESLVEVVVQNRVAVVTLCRPPVNALSDELRSDLLDALTECEHPSIRAVVVTGSPHFAAGADITVFKAVHDGDAALVTGGTARVAGKLESLRKPTIAAIRGYALGGGLEIALGADLRFVATDAILGQPEIRLGLIPGGGGTVRLQRLIGTQLTKDLVYSGRRITADEAVRIGLADRLVPTDDLLERAVTDAKKLARRMLTLDSWSVHGPSVHHPKPPEPRDASGRWSNGRRA